MMGIFQGGGCMGEEIIIEIVSSRRNNICKFIYTRVAINISAKKETEREGKKKRKERKNVCLNIHEAINSKIY